jgi:hypothetical protein
MDWNILCASFPSVKQEMSGINMMPDFSPLWNGMVSAVLKTEIGLKQRCSRVESRPRLLSLVKIHDTLIEKLI